MVKTASENMKDHIFELRRKIWRHDWSSHLYKQLQQLWNESLRKDQAWKGIQARNLCDTGAVLSSQLRAYHVVSSLYTRGWWRMQVNTWKIIYLNCRERYEDMIDHRSYINNSSSCEIKAWEKIRPERGFELITSAILVQCSTNSAIKPTGKSMRRVRWGRSIPWKKVQRSQGSSKYDETSFCGWQFSRKSTGKVNVLVIA